MQHGEILDHDTNLIKLLQPYRMLAEKSTLGTSGKGLVSQTSQLLVEGCLGRAWLPEDATAEECLQFALLITLRWVESPSKKDRLKP